MIGRLAAKRAVASLLEAATGDPVPRSTIEVGNGERREPFFRLIDGAPASARAAAAGLHLSITHSGGRAGAAVSRIACEGRIGIDLEEVLRPMGHLWSYYLRPEEQEALRARAEAEVAFLETAAWSLKEAVSKALGVGLTVPPKEIVVRLPEGRGGVAPVRLLGRALARYDELAGRSLDAYIGGDASFAFTVCLLRVGSV